MPDLSRYDTKHAYPETCRPARFGTCHDRPHHHSRHQAGFTLLELLVVLAILALLAGLVGPRVLEQLSGARSDTARIQIKNIEAALDLFRLDSGRYPSNTEGLQGLIEKPADADRWRGPYLKSAAGLLDPWSTPYRYTLDTAKNSYVIISFGADRTEGGEGENKDIRN